MSVGKKSVASVIDRAKTSTPTTAGNGAALVFPVTSGESTLKRCTDVEGRDTKIMPNIETPEQKASARDREQLSALQGPARLALLYLENDPGVTAHGRNIAAALRRALERED